MSIQFDNSYQIDGAGVLTVPTVLVAAGKTASISSVVSATDFTKNGAGALVLSGGNFFSGYLNINAGALRVSSEANLSVSNLSAIKLTGTLEIAGTFSTTKYINQYGGTIKVLAGQTLTLPNNGQLDGGINNNNAALTKDGDGILFLGGQSSRNGPTTVNAGTLRLEPNAQPGYGAITLGAATLELNNKSFLYSAVNIGAASTVRGLGATTVGLTLPGGVDLFPTMTTGAISDQFNVTFSGTATSGSIINVTGPGLVLPYAPSYAGTWNITGGGTMRTQSSLGSGTSAIEVNNGTLQILTNPNRPINLNNSGAIRMINSQLIPVTTVASGAAVSLGTVSAADIMLITSSNRLLGGAGASINVVGPGLVSASATQTYAGGWSVSAGKLRVSGGNGALGGGVSPIAVNGGALELNGAAITRDIALNAGMLAGSGGSNFANGVTTIAPGGNVSLSGPLAIGDAPNDLTGGNAVTYIHINGTSSAQRVVLAQPSNVAGNWLIDGGGLDVSSDAQLGAASNTITLNPFGTLRCIANVSFARDLNAQGGTVDSNSLTMSMQNAAGSGLTKTGKGTLQLNRIRAGSLIATTDVVKIKHDGAFAATSELDSVTVGSSGNVDLTNNALVVNGSVGSWDGTKYTGVIGLVAKGYNGGAWDGPGGIITSETDAANGLTTLAVMSASSAGLSTPNQFRGLTVAPADTLVGYTWGGDANLDGELNGDDYFALDSNITQSGVVFGYDHGDFNYDGSLNGDDYFIIDSNIVYAQASPPFSNSSGAGFAAVPEPACIGVASMLALLTMKRQRRGRN